MKKLVSLCLVAAMLLSFGTVSIAAQDLDLEKALTEVKSRIAVPENLSRFSYNISQDNNVTYYNFDWSTPDGVAEREVLSIQYANGFISRYSNYRYYDYNSYETKYAKVSKQEAVKLAKEFIGMLNPDYADQISIGETDGYYQTTYNFSINRTVNSIPFYYNTGNISINANTGKLEGFYMHDFSFDLDFKPPQNLISLEDAKKLFGEKIGLKPVYQIFYDNNSNPYAKLCYVLEGDTRMLIDAETGEVFTDSNYYGPIYPMYGYDSKEMAMYSSGYGAERQSPVLSDQEIAALTANKELMTKEEAESTAKSLEIVDLDENMVLSSAYLRESYFEKGSYEWQLNFTTQQSDSSLSDEKQKLMMAAGEMMPYYWSYVTLNAKTKELIDFSVSYNDTKDEKPQYTFEQSEKIAKDAFLKYYAQRLVGFESVPTNSEYTGDTLYYTFRFERKVNGIAVPSNSCNITVNAATGKITNASSRNSVIDFPSAQNMISVQNALDSMFKTVKFELIYSPVFENSDKNQQHYFYRINPASVRAAYAVMDSMIVIDANAGGLLDYNGKPLKAMQEINYEDISGHYAQEAIKRLSDIRVLPRTAKFNPDEDASQLDCLVFFFSLFNGYSRYDDILNAEDPSSIERFYLQLKSSKIIREDEIAPTSTVTREDAVKFIIRFLRIDEYASLKTIYISPFSDVTAETSDYVGHIAIAAGLKIINGNPDGTFSPKENLTRAQIAVILDNYMNR